ncbi:hypothetical protein [Pelagerythrobacter marinus]|uniref:hypothetical protein n=1 Tax=Pelagerythrobacter marinus TaxID=538382 RepID=UPI002AC99AB5|nr:hypothetical protein [Pelagerythrobacter marinus]WPZ05518.1 hypothetical protein T8T98_08735 [Pelagerythrobacter marinus]
MTTPNEERAGHTPWSVKPKFYGDGFHIMSAPIGGRTFRLFSSDCASEADALKAAAAPELLRELDGFVRDLTDSLRNRENTLTINHDALCERIQRALAVIAKARGEV